MKELIYFFAVIVTAYGIGRIILGLFIKPDSRCEDFIFSCGLGLAFLAYSVLAVGSAGLLRQEILMPIFILCGGIAICPFYAFLRRVPWKTYPYRFRMLKISDKFFLAVAVFIGLICLAGAKAPVTGNDALAYHLFHPKIFVREQRIFAIPFTRESMWPYLTEMLFTFAICLKAPSLATLLHYLFGLLSVLAVYGFSRRFISPKPALLSAALFYSAPGIFMQSVYAYVDLSQCF
jgi:hypothetical protein